MKLGVFTVLFAEKSFEEMLDTVKEAGLHAVEIGTGCYPGNSHCDLDSLVESEEARKQFIQKVEERNLIISALAVMAILFPLKRHLQKTLMKHY